MGQIHLSTGLFLLYIKCMNTKKIHRLAQNHLSGTITALPNGFARQENKN